MATAVRINPFDVNPQNLLLNPKPLNDAFQHMRKANEFDATQRFRYDQLDVDEADRLDRRDIDRSRLSLEGRRVAVAEGAAREGQQNRQREMIAHIAGTIDGMEGPTRSAAWAKFVNSQPSMRETLQRYGQNPDDDVNGPRFIMAEALGPQRVAQTDHHRALARNAQMQTQEAAAAPDIRINDAGEAERASAGNALMVHRTAGPSASHMPPIAGPRTQAMPAQAPAGQTSGVPGITLNRPMSSDRAQDYSGGAREADAAQLYPRVRGQDRTLTEPEANRFWTAQWGRQPRAGHKYNIRGEEVPLAAAGAGDRGTRDAIKAGIQQSIVDVADAAERIRQAPWYERTWGHLTDAGEYAATIPTIEAGAASVMHGLSGAQVNIPETERWMRTFVPKLGDGPRRIEGKLAKLQSMLMAINQRQGGNWTEQQKLEMRNTMRESMGMRPITIEQHMQQMGQSLTEPQPLETMGEREDRRATERPTGGARTERRSLPQQGPRPGEVQDGYRFRGGNPADPGSWERVR